jgi:hypothetical protein
MSRQAVHRAIERGTPDAWHVATPSETGALIEMPAVELTVGYQTVKKIGGEWTTEAKADIST